MNFSRREFSKLLFGAAALSLVDLEVYAHVLDEKKSMRRLATRTASGEGVWKNLEIEGKVPKEINGTLFRTAPGKSESYGVKLRHLFDGDAYLTGYDFENGKVSLRGRFLPEARRIEELEAGKMLYGEYGTAAPDGRGGGKNQPNVNVIEWRGKLLGLSEGSLPTIINPDTFDHEGYESFGGVVPEYLTFTAHPRFDPENGDMFAWGFEKRPPGTMHIIRVSRETGKAETIYKAPQLGFNMVHDAMLTNNYFVILIAPMQYNVAMLQQGKPLGDALSYAENVPTRLYAYPRDNAGGKARPIMVELPPYLIFHYGNAFEIEGSKIRFEAIANTDGQIIEVLRKWRDDEIPEFKRPLLKQITVDLEKRSVLSTVDIAEDVEFPRYDMRRTGRASKFLYVAEKLYGAEASILKIDLEKRTSVKSVPDKNRTVAEPVFVPRPGKKEEDEGWVLAQGFDAVKDENFLEIRDAQNLDLEARVWSNRQHFPLGFHGNFAVRK